jgi:DNA-binding NtrC family response regulator
LAELPVDVLDRLAKQPWPGNVRELRNAVEAYIALGTLPEMRGPDLPVLDYAMRQLVDTERPYAEQKELVADRFTRCYLQALLTRTGGNQSEAARISGLERSYLGKLLVKHGIAKPR